MNFLNNLDFLSPQNQKKTSEIKIYYPLYEILQYILIKFFFLGLIKFHLFS